MPTERYPETALACEEDISTPMAVGVLALQGSFKEHIVCLRKLGVDAVEVRKLEQLVGLSGLIIPGGESTTMAKLAEKNNLFPALREFSTAGKPIWGTCAGLIFLADRASGVKEGAQKLLGGLDCTVHRNFFGSQLNSFEMELSVPTLASREGGAETCRAVFIRAPAIVDVGSSVEVLAEYPLAPGQAPQQEVGKDKVIVAVKQNNMLATAFHPELTSDLRWHKLFLNMINDGGEGAQVPGAERIVAKKTNVPPALDQIRDMPVFREASFLSLELQ